MPDDVPKERASIELDTDLAFQERFWTAQRVSWLVFGAIIVAALAGLSGRGGVFAHAVISNETASLEYSRFMRWEASDRMTLVLPPSEKAEPCRKVNPRAGATRLSKAAKPCRCAGAALDHLRSAAQHLSFVWADFPYPAPPA